MDRHNALSITGFRVIRTVNGTMHIAGFIRQQGHIPWTCRAILNGQF